MHEFKSNYLIHKLSLWPVVFSRSYRPEGQGKGSLNSGIHRIKSSINKFVLKERRFYAIFMPKSQTSTVLAYIFTVYELDGKRPKEIYSICQTIHCFTLYALFLTCQANKNVLILLINIVLPLAIRILSDWYSPPYWNTRQFPKTARLGNSLLVLLGCPSER